jgi:hypothetical protein
MKQLTVTVPGLRMMLKNHLHYAPSGASRSEGEISWLPCISLLRSLWAMFTCFQGIVEMVLSNWIKVSSYSFCWKKEN